MNKILIFFILILNSFFSFGNDGKLKKTRQKYDNYNFISYTAIAHYPNPETEETKSFNTFYIFNNFKNKDFEFYSKTKNLEEFYKNGDYSNVNNDQKSIYKFEEKQNQTDAIKNSRLVQYGPTFLLKHDWKYEDEVIINEKKQSHYTFIEDVHQYEEKTIKIEFHIYISQNHTISKFERKSFVDNKLGQTVTFEFANYNFSKKEINFKSTLPQKYALKYYEREEINPLEKGRKAPIFEVKDINNNPFSSQNFIGNETLFLFSATNCGASKEVVDFINNGNLKLPDDLKLVNVYGSDKKESVEKYLKNSTEYFTIIVDQKEIETKYQISGYPVMYRINENGIISESFDGFVQIIQFLKSLE